MKDTSPKRQDNHALAQPPEILEAAAKVLASAKKLYLHIAFHDSKAPYVESRLQENISRLQKDLDAFAQQAEKLPRCGVRK